MLAISDQSGARLALAVERFGRSKPERLEIVRLDCVPTAAELSREEFCEQLRRILAEQFPDETVEKISIAADLEHSLSRLYTRGICKRGPVTVAFLAVPMVDTPGAIESSLTYASLWYDHARQTAAGARLSALRLILPKGKSVVLAHHLSALGASPPVVVYELDSASGWKNEIPAPAAMLLLGLCHGASRKSCSIVRRKISPLLLRWRRTRLHRTRRCQPEK